MHVKIFAGNRKENILEKEINKWLAKNRNFKVLDIKYGYSADGGVGWYSALVFYEDDGSF